MTTDASDPGGRTTLQRALQSRPGPPLRVHAADPVAPSVRAFLATEAGGAVLLLAATVVALVWANSPLGGRLRRPVVDAARVLGRRLVVRDGPAPLGQRRADGGLLPRRRARGEPRGDDRRAARPAHGRRARAGRHRRAGRADRHLPADRPPGGGRRAGASSMSTDTAFLVGVLALFGPRCPDRLRLFLLTLAIVDDIGAISVMAIFYTDDVELVPLACRGRCSRRRSRCAGCGCGSSRRTWWRRSCCGSRCTRRGCTRRSPVCARRPAAAVPAGPAPRRRRRDEVRQGAQRGDDGGARAPHRAAARASVPVERPAAARAAPVVGVRGDPAVRAGERGGRAGPRVAARGRDVADHDRGRGGARGRERRGHLRRVGDRDPHGARSAARAGAVRAPAGRRGARGDRVHDRAVHRRAGVRGRRAAGPGEDRDPRGVAGRGGARDRAAPGARRAAAAVHAGVGGAAGPAAAAVGGAGGGGRRGRGRPPHPRPVSHRDSRCYTRLMPTTKPRHAITETDSIAHALDVARQHWPDEPATRLLTRLIETGASVVEREELAVALADHDSPSRP